jgi:hypothetical protein
LTCKKRADYNTARDIKPVLDMTCGVAHKPAGGTKPVLVMAKSPGYKPAAETKPVSMRPPISGPVTKPPASPPSTRGHYGINTLSHERTVVMLLFPAIYRFEPSAPVKRCYDKTKCVT